ncbi:MAG: hypothetical protein ACP5RD_06495 [bacterium]|jgi:hypothetical protein
MNKKIFSKSIFTILLIFLLLIFIKISFAGSYYQEELKKYYDLGDHILSLYYAFYNKIIPSSNGKIYNDNQGLIITTYYTNTYKYFGSEDNDFIMGYFAIEINISNDILYKDNKQVYYYIDKILDSKTETENKKDYNLTKGKVITAQAGCNPLLDKGKLPNLGDESNYASIYILCY